MGVDHPADGLNIMGELGGKGIGFPVIGTGNADIDGGRLAEVQNLVDDVGGLEKELQQGEAPRQIASHLCHEVGRRGMLFFEGNEDFTIHWSDCRRIAEGDVHAAIGQPDIVEDGVDLVFADDLADGMLDVAEIGLRLFDPRSRRRPHMQAHLPGVHLREKIPAQHGKQHERGHHQDDEKTDAWHRPRESPGQSVAVAGAKALEAPDKPEMDRHQRIA